MFVYTGNRKSQYLSFPLLLPERIGPFIPGFRLEEFCGKGGNSSVWKGKDLKGNPFAIRIAYKKGDPKGREDFRSFLLYREKIPPHKNLLPLLFYGEKEAFFYFVTPLADNLFPGKKYLPDTLSNRLQRRVSPPLPEEIFFLMGELTKAVGFLHKNGLAHNDLKPENILFIKKTPLISDFGLAAPLPEKSRGGTHGYRPPWENAPGRECDIFALGKILYTLFTGQDPTLYPLLPEDLPYPERLTAFFCDIISRTCSMERRRRLSSTTDLGELLRKGEKRFL